MWVHTLCSQTAQRYVLFHLNRLQGSRTCTGGRQMTDWLCRGYLRRLLKSLVRETALRLHESQNSHRSRSHFLCRKHIIRFARCNKTLKHFPLYQWSITSCVWMTVILNTWLKHWGAGFKEQHFNLSRGWIPNPLTPFFNSSKADQQMIESW